MIQNHIFWTGQCFSRYPHLAQNRYHVFATLWGGINLGCLFLSSWPRPVVGCLGTRFWMRHSRPRLSFLCFHLHSAWPNSKELQADLPSLGQMVGLYQLTSFRYLAVAYLDFSKSQSKPWTDCFKNQRMSFKLAKATSVNFYRSYSAQNPMNHYPNP